MESRINTTPGWQDPAKASCSKAADGLFVAWLGLAAEDGPCEEEEADGVGWVPLLRSSQTFRS